MSRILYLSADRGITLAKRSGATAHLRSLVGAFAGLGHDVLVLTPSPVAPGELAAPAERIPTPPLLETLLSEVEAPVARAQREEQRRRKRVIHALGHAWNNVVVEQALREIVPRFRPDLVFELHSPFGVAGPVTCNALSVRHLLNVHAPLAWEGATFRAQALQEAAEVLEGAALAAARRIVTNSAEMRDLLVESSVDPGKIRVVMNGVDLDLFAPDGPSRRAELPDGIVVGFCGSLKAWHGIDVLVEAFRELASDPRVHLLVVGDGPLRKDVDALAASLPGRVTTTGSLQLEDVPPWIRAMDVAVAPYPPLEKFYFSPLKSLEYMAAGRASVSSAIGQLRELVTDGVTGLLVPPGDATALAGSIRRLVDDPALRARLGDAAAEEARARHAWKDRAAEILAAGLEQAAP